mmetsp:Transcript_17509/g.49456  ORF Transcript_17509/g.49456 Transcript_17509/m.49456 type:complete len:208 (+) Transcript_17509:546-1169(+)
MPPVTVLGVVCEHGVQVSALHGPDPFLRCEWNHGRFGSDARSSIQWCQSSVLQVLDDHGAQVPVSGCPPPLLEREWRGIRRSRECDHGQDARGNEANRQDRVHGGFSDQLILTELNLFSQGGNEGRRIVDIFAECVVANQNSRSAITLNMNQPFQVLLRVLQRASLRIGAFHGHLGHHEGIAFAAWTLVIAVSHADVQCCCGRRRHP